MSIFINSGPQRAGTLFAYMSRISIKEAKQQATGTATLAGFVRNRRAHKGVVFVDLKDISGQIQLVFSAEQAEAYSLAEKLNLESVIEVTGELKEKPLKKGETLKDYELSVSQAEIISLADENLPIPVLTKIDNEANLDNRLDWRWLDLRREENQLIFKVWTKLEEGMREYFLASSFVQIYTPCFMNTASETGSEVFAVKYFDRQAYLAQSPQFYKQMAMAAGLEKVFMVGTVFRAEPSFTTRHVTEFTGWDFEVSYLDSLAALMDIEEEMLVSGFRKVQSDLPEMAETAVPTRPFPRLTFAAAKAKLQAAGIKGEKAHDFSPEEERELGRIIKEENSHDFLFVTDYPIEARPFYHMYHKDDQALTESFDLFYRGLEITTGALREHRLAVLEKQATAKGMNLEELKDYLNFFRYGCPRHGGAGIGPGRIVMKMLDLSTIKEACFLPRDVKRLTP